jgi:glutaredoxin
MGPAVLALSPGEARLRARRSCAGPTLNMSRVVLYHAEGCSLCDRAREQLAALQEELGFELAEVDIGGDEALESRHREWLPVVEIDGERAFVYVVDEAAFRRKVGAQSRS